MPYGVTPTGFNRKTFENIWADMETRAKNLFGNEIDLSETSPEGIMLRLAAYEMAEKWKMGEDVYNSAYVDTAEGISLDYTGKYAGNKRKGSIKARAPIVLDGIPGTVVQKDFKIETGGESSKVFLLENEVILDGLGAASTYAVAENPGSDYNVSANTINVITNPIPGLNSVNNPESATGGQEKEDDILYRERYYQSVAKGGASTGDSIRASLLEVDGVRAALVIRNNTINIDADGRPPKSVESYVLGGQPDDIGKAILSTIAAGIEPYGTESVVVNDDAGQPQTIGFTYATVIDTYINVSITKNSKYPSNGDQLVRTALIKYVGGQDAESIIYTGLGMDQDVIFKWLITTVNTIPGIDDFTIEVSTNGQDFTQGNIPVGKAEVAETDHTKVVVSSA